MRALKTNSAHVNEPNPTADGRDAALARVGVRAVLKIFGKWGLTDADAATLLGGVGVSTLRRWRHQVASDQFKIDARRDLLDRLSLVLGIYKALHILFSTESQADGWVRRPNSNPLFGGRSAMDVMLDGGLDDLYRVRRFLDAQRG